MYLTHKKALSYYNLWYNKVVKDIFNNLKGVNTHEQKKYQLLVAVIREQHSDLLLRHMN